MAQKLTVLGAILLIIGIVIGVGIGYAVKPTAPGAQTVTTTITETITQTVKEGVTPTPTGAAGEIKITVWASGSPVDVTRVNNIEATAEILNKMLEAAGLMLE